MALRMCMVHNDEWMKQASKSFASAGSLYLSDDWLLSHVEALLIKQLLFYHRKVLRHLPSVHMRFECPWALFTLNLRCPKDVFAKTVMFLYLEEVWAAMQQQV